MLGDWGIWEVTSARPSMRGSAMSSFSLWRIDHDDANSALLGAVVEHVAAARRWIRATSGARAFEKLNKLAGACGAPLRLAPGLAPQR